MFQHINGSMCAVHMAYFTLNHLNGCGFRLSEQWGVPERQDELLMFVMQ